MMRADATDAAGRRDRLARLRLPIFGVILCAAALAAYGVSVGYRWQRMDYIPSPPMTDLARHVEWTELPDLGEVAFRDPAGHRIAGWYQPSRNRAAVILLMGTNADRASMLPELRILASAGFGVLAYDSPGYGMSEGRIEWRGSEVEALRAAVDWLAARPDVDPRRIGALGFSMGGVVLAREAARDARVRATAFLAAPIDTRAKRRWDRRAMRWGPLSEFGSWLVLRRYQGTSSSADDVTPELAIARIAPRPVLVMGGSSDTEVPEEVTRGTFALAREPRELWIIPGANHGHYTEIAPAQYSERLTRFFLHALPE